MSRHASEIRFDAPGREVRERPLRASIERRLDACLTLTIVACVAALGTALTSQHRFDMDPCPWCILQRLIFMAIVLAALLGLIWRRVAGRVVASLLVLLLSLSGIATALWQHFVAARSSSCGLSFADRFLTATGLPKLLPSVFEPRASCADAAVNMLGLPYALWGFAGFVCIGVVALVALALARRA